MGSIFGKIFTFTSYGESHGAGIGGVVDGCPSGIALSVERVQKALDARRPSQDCVAASARQESDKVQILSGTFENRTTGTPIAFFIPNEDARPADYDRLAHIWRPGHADMVYDAKYGFRDHRGGGRASGRETASRVAAGAIAQAFLDTMGIKVRAYTLEIGGIPAYPAHEVPPIMEQAVAEAHTRPYFAPHGAVVAHWEEAILKAREEGDSLGGVVRIEVLDAPAGLGEPVFDKLDAALAHAFFSVGAVKGVALGSGFQAARMRGSEHNDELRPAEKLAQSFASNHAGGILGGISTGAPILVDVAIKPIASIHKPQQTLDTAGKPVSLHIEGRHDICAIPRVVPVLQAMAALVMADMVLLQRRMGRENIPATGLSKVLPGTLPQTAATGFAGAGLTGASSVSLGLKSFSSSTLGKA